MICSDICPDNQAFGRTFDAFDRQMSDGRLLFSSLGQSLDIEYSFICMADTPGRSCYVKFVCAYENKDLRLIRHEVPVDGLLLIIPGQMTAKNSLPLPHAPPHHQWI